MTSTCFLMPPTASSVFCMVSSPLRAAAAASVEMRATRCELSAIWRDVASSSLIVVEISVIAVACSLAPETCWLAAACSSADELCTCCTADPICCVSDRTSRKPASDVSSTESSVPSDDRRAPAARGALDLGGALPQEIPLLALHLRHDAADVVHRPLSFAGRDHLLRRLEPGRPAHLDRCVSARRACGRPAARPRPGAVAGSGCRASARASPSRPAEGLSATAVYGSRNASSPVITKPRWPVSASLSRLSTRRTCSSTACVCVTK